MKNCSDYAELLSAYVDGELSGDEQAVLNQHLSLCADCRAQLELLQQIHTQAPSLMQEVPAGFSARVMQNIASDKKSEKRFFLARFKFTAIAAVIALLVFASGQLHDAMPRVSQDSTLAETSATVSDYAAPRSLTPSTLSPAADAAASPAQAEQKARDSVENSTAAFMPDIPYSENFRFYVVVRSQEASSLFAGYPAEVHGENCYITVEAGAQSDILAALNAAELEYTEQPGDPDAEYGLIIIPR